MLFTEPSASPSASGPLSPLSRGEDLGSPSALDMGRREGDPGRLRTGAPAAAADIKPLLSDGEAGIDREDVAAPPAPLGEAGVCSGGGSCGKLAAG